VSICGEAILNLHALNNEGSEGNALITRMVEIVDQCGKSRTVNAISGDMLKHVQVEHLHAYSMEHSLPLCNGCRVRDPNRICIDPEFTGRTDLKSASDGILLTEVLKKCAIDDLAGILITGKIGQGGAGAVEPVESAVEPDTGADEMEGEEVSAGRIKSRSVPRKSCVEFGWAVGIPDRVRTDSYFHVKYVPDRGKGSGEGENLGQNIFHRPASSGAYAVVVNIDLLRVGRNDISLEYVILPEPRLARVRALLVSVMNTFIRLNGAHRNTQLPHLVDFKGSIITSTSSLPAPSISALNQNYREQLEKTCAQLNQVGQKNSLKASKFDDLAQFTEQMVQLSNSASVEG
jgi:CRISPR-associated protein Cst2